MTAAESAKNLATTHRECLAGVWDIHLHHPYVEKSRITVIAGRTALKWLLKMIEAADKPTRM